MEFATGALGILLPKLSQLLQGEYQLQKDVRKNIKFLTKELEATHAALRSVGEVPTEQLSELVSNWARDARELSYDMEDVVDTFLVSVEGPEPPSKSTSKTFMQKMRSMLTVGKRHEIGEQIKDIKERVVELAARRDRWKVDPVNRVIFVDTVNHVTYVDTVNHATIIDPGIKALYTKATELVGIDEAKKEIIMKLTKGDEMSPPQPNVVSIVGIGGLGKTTLAKTVYDEIKSQFDCIAFVTVSRNSDIKKFLKDMVYELDKGKYGNIHSTSLDVKHLMDLIRDIISEKRYFIVIDDIWDISKWDIVNYALQNNNTGCNIITTTRNVTVANDIGGAYEMKPLSQYCSRVLLYRRIFGNKDQEKCLNEELVDVSDRILKKCAGVPLAIITIASLLASKGRNNKMDWYEVCNSIGNGMENSVDVKNMRNILSYSYNDLPYHLRTCLLYISMFPEDFNIEKNRLIRLWIAEGFIQYKKQGNSILNSIFEHGQSYFNELVNRSMIQPVYDRHGIEIECCRMHDMVLDLVRYLSREENFITILGDTEHASASTKVRRLSLQKAEVDHANTEGTMSMQDVRSVVFFSSTIGEMPVLHSFKVLRVLDLEDCKHLGGYRLKSMESLIQLRYLSLRSTYIDQLPEEVGKLKFLQTLDVRNNNISCLPWSVAHLKHLLYLSVDSDTRVPNGIGSFRSLEVLSWLNITAESTDLVEELGLLTELRVLCISLRTVKCNIYKLVESLSKLQKIKTLLIAGGRRNIGDVLETWVAPRHLGRLQTDEACWFSRLPAWMNNFSQFQDLSELSIAVRELQQEDLNILGRLPTLCHLGLEVDHEDLWIIGSFVIGDGSFPCLVRCHLQGFVVPVVFENGAMPRLKWLRFDFYARGMREIESSDSGFDLGMGNLPSLQEISVLLRHKGATSKEGKEAKALVRKLAEIHPNKPTIWI